MSATSTNRIGCLGVFLVLLLCLSLLFNALFLVGEMFSVRDERKFRETEITEPVAQTKTKIAVIRLDGLIASSIPGYIGDSMVDDIKLQLKQAIEDSNVRAIVIAIDSPGGEVTASDAIYNAIRKAREKKPIVVMPGAFGQSDITASPHLSLSASARLDVHSDYGTFFSPRLAALFRSGRWNSRVSVGTGFFGPSALTEETEAAGLSRLEIPRALRAEQGRSASLDISRTDGPASYTVTLFASSIRHPIDVDRSAGLVLTNLDEPTTNIGVEVIGTLRREPFALTTTYTYVQSREQEGDARLDVPLTPRHSAGLVGMWEREDVGRVGVELYYTGVQRLEENPFRTESEPYVILGLLGEWQFGRLRLFINGENLTDVRQTKWDPLSARRARLMAAGRPTRGRRSKGGPSTVACGSVSRAAFARHQSA